MGADLATLGTSSVSLEVAPVKADELLHLIAALRTSAKDYTSGYTDFMAAAPAIHYMSLSVTTSPLLDPLFVIEVNYDYPEGVFWLQLDAAIGDQLRDMLRLTKRPRDGDAALYDAVTEPGSRVSVAAYLERRAAKPSIFHHGNRGLTRARIVDEYALFRATRTVIAANDARWRRFAPTDVHREMRAALLPQFAWLGTAAPPRITRLERVVDFVRFAAAVVILYLILSLPGFFAARLATDRWFLIGCAVAAGAIAVGLRRLRPPSGDMATSDGANLAGSIFSHWRPILLGLAIYLVVIGVSGVVTIAVFQERSWSAALAETARPMFLSLLATLTVVLPGLVLWLRALELRDSVQEAPHVEADELAGMARHEDWLCQNHMISIVVLKPGILRTVLIHAGHRLLHFWLQLKITDGYLGSMRTIHFAHWAFVDNGARLMFHSNYDLNWEAYLDDFIEKAHQGLTIAWGAGLGFPPTTMLIGEGASRGRLFKAWARQSMGLTGFWYSAYPDLTVDQIERNNRVANGLRQASLSPAAAGQWMHDL